MAFVVVEHKAGSLGQHLTSREMTEQGKRETVNVPAERPRHECGRSELRDELECPSGCLGRVQKTLGAVETLGHRQGVDWLERVEAGSSCRIGDQI